MFAIPAGVCGRAGALAAGGPGMIVVRGASEVGFRRPKAYTEPSCVVTNTLPSATAIPEKCVQPEMLSWLDHSSLPVVASSACRMAWALLRDSRPVRI